MTSSSELPPELRRVLGRYSQRIDVGTIKSVTRRSGFSGAGVWRVETSDGDWAVRRWPSPGLPSVRLRGLHRLLEHIRDSGIDFVSPPIPTNDGDTLLAIAGDIGLWQVEPWLPGMADFHASPSEPRLWSAMAALARWHQAAARFVPTSDIREWFGSQAAGPSPAVTERLQASRQLNSERFARLQSRIEQSPSGEQRSLCRELVQRLPRLAPVIAAELASLSNVPVPLQPCLRDVWHDHVLFTGEQVTGLIDASACRTENIAADLSRLIGSLVEDVPRLRQVAVDEYQKLRPLSLAEEALFAALDRSSVVLSAATWLEWLYRSDRSFEQPEPILARLRHWHRRLARLDSGD